MNQNDLEQVLHKYDSDSTETPNGDIRIRCPYRENHEGSSDGSKSMYVHFDKNMFHCFSCGRTGTAVSMFTEKFKIPLYKVLTAIQPSFEPTEKKRRVLRPYGEVISFRDQPSFLLERGFSKELLKHFRVGAYFDDGVEVATIPYLSGGKVYGMKFRVEEPDRFFWYSDDFYKGTLYNYGDSATRIIVEGETDVWAAYQNGSHNTSGILGTSFTDGQIKEMCSFEEVIPATDNDDAGLLCRELLELHLRGKTETRYIPYEASDPGACEKEDWQYALKHKEPYEVYSMQMAMHIGDDYLALKERAAKQFEKRFA